QLARQDPGTYGLLDRGYVGLIQFGDLPKEILLFHERQEIHQPVPLIPFPSIPLEAEIDTEALRKVTAPRGKAGMDVVIVVAGERELSEMARALGAVAGFGCFLYWWLQQ